LAASYDKSVFINCPFDDAYKRIFDALVFAVHDAGFFARSSREVGGASIRFSTIFTIIAECKYGIHDLSRTQVSKKSQLPRFNMPLELGVDLGCQAFGQANHRLKSCLILDRVPYRYQKFVSDLAGVDISTHRNRPGDAIGAVRDWLATESGIRGIPGKSAMAERYVKFRKDMPDMCNSLRTSVKDLTFKEFRALVDDWIAILPA
jgi:hypothetical protein